MDQFHVCGENITKCSLCTHAYNVLKNHTANNHFYYDGNKCLICGHLRICSHKYKKFVCVTCKEPIPSCDNHNFVSEEIIEIKNVKCNLCGVSESKITKCEITHHCYNNDNLCFKCGYTRIIVPLDITLPLEILCKIFLSIPILYKLAAMCSTQLYEESREALYYKYITRPMICCFYISDLCRYRSEYAFETGRLSIIGFHDAIMHKQDI